MNPSWGQGRVMAALSLKDGVSTKDLSFLLDMALPSLNEMLAKLAKVGYVERRSSEADGRIILNYITSAGRAAYAQQNDDEAFPYLDCIDDADINILSGYVDKIIEQLDAMLSQHHSEESGPQDGMHSHHKPPHDMRRPMHKRPPKHSPRAKHPPMPDYPEGESDIPMKKPSFMDRLRPPKPEMNDAEY